MFGHHLKFEWEVSSILPTEPPCSGMCLGTHSDSMKWGASRHPLYLHEVDVPRHPLYLHEVDVPRHPLYLHEVDVPRHPLYLHEVIPSLLPHSTSIKWGLPRYLYRSTSYFALVSVLHTWWGGSGGWMSLDIPTPKHVSPREYWNHNTEYSLWQFSIQNY